MENEVNKSNKINEYVQLAKNMYSEGNFSKSLENYEKAINLYKEVFEIDNLPERDDEYLATLYNNLAQVYFDSGNYIKAEEYNQQSLIIREEFLGENHPTLAISYNNLAATYCVQGKYEEALQLYKKSLNIRKSILGENHPDTAQSYNNLASLYKTLANYDIAYEYYQKALEIYLDRFGEEHPDTAITYNNLADLNKTQGKYEEALSGYQTAYDILLKELGENHLTTQQVKINLSILKSELVNNNVSELVNNNVFSDIEKFYPCQFIPDLEFFVGRTQLLEDLKNQLNVTHRASIHDISGLGKTFTTYKFTDKNQDDYEKIFFVRANKEEMMQSLAEIGVLLNSPLKDEPDQSKQALGFKNWLEKNDNWLVIYDNVDIPVELYPFVPLNKEGDCIFTSNFSSITRLGDEITINKLDKDDAESLLFSRANDKPHSKVEFSDIKEQKAFENIVKEIDGHPLSLNTTGAFISGNFISFAEFERKMNKTPEILVKNEDGFDKYQNKTALKAFSIAIDDISIKKDDDRFENSPGLARKLLFAASIIAPDNIPEQFLRRILREIAEIDFEAEENADLWLEIRRKLFAYDLLKYDKDAKTFKTHRLIQKVIQTKQSDDEKKTVCNDVSIALDELFPYSRHETKNECELFAPHAIVLIEMTEKADLSSKKIASIYSKIGRYLRDTVKYQNSIVYFEKAITLYRNEFEKDNENLAFCLNELALVYDLQGRYDEAIEKYKEALRIDEKTIGKEHPGYATRLSNLANIYQSQGRYDEAIDKYKEALRIDEKTIGKEHPDYAIRLNNLALVYDSQGRYAEAIEKLEEALWIDEKTIGKEHPGYATHLSNLALAYDSQGRYAEAIEKYKEALRIDEKTIGKEHPDYATRLSNLATVYRSQGRYDEAIDKYKEALRIDEKTIGKEHPDYAIRLNNLALVYQSQGRYAEAIEKLEEALRIGEKTISKEHPDYAIRLSNLALAYDSQGRYDEAIEKYKEALWIDEKTIGKEHPDYAIHLSNLATVYENQVKYKEALDLYEEVLRIFEKSLPENHPHITQLRESVARCREKLGEK